MTKCNKNEANLKSTVYNQTGQNLFERLSAYDSMSSHLRRILLAKNVVDTKNKSYANKRKKLSKTTMYKRPFKGEITTNNLIDRLAYDTRHHPADVIRINLDARCSRQSNRQRCFADSYDNYVNCSQTRLFSERTHEETNRGCCQDGSTSRTNKSTSSLSSRQAKHNSCSTGPNVDYYAKKMKPQDIKYTEKIQDFLMRQRSEEAFSRCDSISNMVRNEARRLSTSSQSYEDCETPQKREEAAVNRHLVQHGRDDDAKYAEFVYGITQEIMRNGLYTDEELHEVFKKHLNENKEILNMSKMLYEIYQLKISLNVLDDSDMDDEMEDLIHAQQLLSVNEIRPPTPPKILDDNKVIEKLMSYQKVTEDRRESSAGGKSGGTKSVVLIDANPELLVTERDVLLSLMEADINPNQAQKICKSLFHKSRNTSVADAVQIETRRGNDERMKARDTHSEQNLTLSAVQEKSCITSDLVSKDDKNVQVKQQSTS